MATTQLHPSGTPGLPWSFSAKAEAPRLTITRLSVSGTPTGEYNFALKTTPTSTSRAISTGATLVFQTARGLNKSIGVGAVGTDRAIIEFDEGSGVVNPITIVSGTFLTYAAVGIDEHLDPDARRRRRSPMREVPNRDEEANE